MANFTLGIDLGKSRDYTALCVVERIEAWTGRIEKDAFGVQSHDLDDHFHLVHIERFKLGTPYTSIVKSVGELLDTDELRDQTVVILDATGVGSAIVDMFRDAFRREEFGAYWPIPITITGGEHQHFSTVPKRDLVSRVVALLETGRIKAPATLPIFDVLVKEMQAFRVKVSQSGHDSYEAWREKDHDDLVLALALSVWHTHDRSTPRWKTRTGQILDPDQYADGHRSRLLNELLDGG